MLDTRVYTYNEIVFRERMREKSILSLSLENTHYLAIRVKFIVLDMTHCQ